MGDDEDANGGPERVEISLPASLAADLTDRPESLGYTSRDDLVESVLADALRHPEFDRADLRAMLTAETEIQAGKTHSSADVAAEVGTDRPDVETNEWDWVLTDAAKSDLDRRDDYARERIVSQLDEIVSGEWRNPTEDLDALAESPHDKLLVGPFRLGCRVDEDAKLLYVLRVRMRGS